MAPDNTARDLLSEEAKKDGNSFWQTRRQISHGGNTSIYVSRIYSMVIVLGITVFVLGASLVYLVLRPNPAPVIIQQAAPSSGSADAAAASFATKSVVVVRSPIAEGEQILPGSIMSLEVSADVLPEGVVPAGSEDLVLNQYALRDIAAGQPISIKDVTSTKFKSMPFEIPEGYRALTITVDGRTGVEGFAKPGTIVDVLWFHSDSRGRQRVVTIVSQAKVLSVGGETNEEGKQVAVVKSTNATLLVTAKQAKVIELARNLGTLSLSLVGQKENSAENKEEPVTIQDVLDTADEAKGGINGAVIVTNPVTGKQEWLVLKQKAWTVDNSDEATTKIVELQSRRRAFGNGASLQSEQ